MFQSLVVRAAPSCFHFILFNARYCLLCCCALCCAFFPNTKRMLFQYELMSFFGRVLDDFCSCRRQTYYVLNCAFSFLYYHTQNHFAFLRHIRNKMQLQLQKLNKCRKNEVHLFTYNYCVFYTIKNIMIGILKSWFR